MTPPVDKPTKLLCVLIVGRMGKPDDLQFFTIKPLIQFNCQNLYTN